MFKYFRLYQNWILAIGGTLLMVVFLIQGTLSSLKPDPLNQPIGTINGKPITRYDLRNADTEIRILANISPLLAGQGSDASLKWLLMVHEAKTMGIAVSSEEVLEAKNLLGLTGDEEEIATRAKQLGTSNSGIDTAVRDWLIVEQYKELVNGLGHLTVKERLGVYSQAMQAIRMGGMGYFNMILASADGNARVSEPLLSHFLDETQATVQIAAVPVLADQYLGKVQSVDPKELTSLFDHYRTHLPGDPDDQGFKLGYKTPDRVKLEYLAVPIDRVRATIQLDETEILTYYVAHKEEFRPQPAGTQPTTLPATPLPPVPDDAARGKIIDRLTEDKTRDAADHIIKAAASILGDQERSLTEANGYRDIPAGWKPVSLEAVAKQVQEQLGVLPDVRRLDDRWLDSQALARLPGIGMSRLPAGRGANFTDYVMSAKELAPKTGNTLAIYHLQVNMPSQILEGYDGSNFLFRLLAAEPARVPASLDEVKDLVTRDARHLAAYKLLVQDQSTWQDKLKNHSLEELAKELDTNVITPPDFNRRQIGMGETSVPDVAGIGSDAGFVDGVFALADQVATMGGIAATKPSLRSKAIPCDEQMALYLVRLDGYTPIKRSAYEKMKQSPNIGTYIQKLLLPSGAKDPLALAALKKRVGYVPAKAGKTDASKEDSTPPSDDNVDPMVGL